MWFVLKVLLSAVLISFISWLSGKKPVLAGFLTALPITTLLVLAFSHFEWKDGAQAVTFAKNVFVAVPVTLTFFVPFLLAQKLNLSFWTCYTSGLVLLGLGYFVHTLVAKFI